VTDTQMTDHATEKYVGIGGMNRLRCARAIPHSAYNNERISFAWRKVSLSTLI